MTNASRSIARLLEELKVRRRIYKAWIASLDHEGPDDLVPYLEEYPVFYFRLKRWGLALPGPIERKLVGPAQAAGARSVTAEDLLRAEEAGVFEALDPRFARWIAIAWGRMACREFFLRLGVRSQDFIEALELQLVLGIESESLSNARRAEVLSYLGELEIETILLQGLATRAELFALVGDLSKADTLAA